MKFHIQSPLAYKVLQRFIASSVLMFSAIILLLGSFELYEQRRLVQETAEQYMQRTADIMSIALWNYDLRQVRALAESFLVIDGVQSVEVADSSGETLISVLRTPAQSMPAEPANNAALHKLTQSYTHQVSGSDVGNITLQLQLPGARELIDGRFMIIAGTALALLALFTAFMFFYLRREVISPIVKVSNFIRSIPADIEQTPRPKLTADSKADNEIGELAASVNDFVDHIIAERDARHRAELEASSMSEEVERIGRITAAQSIATLIAHEINQPLGAALFNAESALSMLNRQPGADAALKTVLQDIVSQTNRASEVVQSIRNIVQNSRTPPEPVSARALITDAMQLVAYDPRFRYIPVEFTNIEDTVDFYVLGDSKQLQRIIINILANAADAIKGAGIDNGWITIGLARRSQASFNISISDNGPGLTPDFLSINIKPYLTSKPDGMGVGLWIAQLLTERHGGSIEFANNSVSGALFRIALPICDPDSTTDQAEV